MNAHNTYEKSAIAAALWYLRRDFTEPHFLACLRVDASFRPFIQRESWMEKVWLYWLAFSRGVRV